MSSCIGIPTGRSLSGGKTILISNSHATRWHKLTSIATLPMRWQFKLMNLHRKKKLKAMKEHTPTHCQAMCVSAALLIALRFVQHRLVVQTRDPAQALTKKEELCKLSSGLERGRRAKVRAKANLEVRPTTCRTWCSAKREETPSTMLSRRYAVWSKSSFYRLCFFLNYLVDIIQL